MKHKLFISAQLLSKLISQIKTPFFNKQYFEYSHLIINDPSSFVPKNVTPNCSMLDLILTYFKSIYLFIENIEKVLYNNNKYQQPATDVEISEIVQLKIAEIDKDNLIKKIFSLKDIKDCEIEANI